MKPNNNDRKDVLYIWVAHDPTNWKDPSMWIASFKVRCNLVDLMKGGFFWNEENIEAENSYVAQETDPDWKQNPYSHHRIIHLRDTITTSSPEWTAHVRISANSYGALARVKMGDLDHTNIYNTNGYNAQNKLVYHFLHDHDESINCIFGNMPLKGFWAWPREGG